MPVFINEIQGYENNIARPMVMEVIKQMAERSQMPKDVAVRYVGNGSALSVVNSTLDKTPLPNRLPGDTRIEITVSETYDPDRALSTAVLRPENPPFFKDTHLDIYLWPVKNRVKYVVTVKYIASDRTAAQTWYTNMKRKYSQGVSEYLHEVNYHYPIPHEHIYKIGELFKLRQNNKPINETVGAYLKRCFTKNFTVISNQIGKNQEFVIRENQVRILAYYDFTDNPPLPEKENDAGVYSVSFNYNFDYDRVEEVAMSYPYMVHNQVIPETLRPPITHYGTEDMEDNPTISESLMREFTYDSRTAATIQSNPGVPIPVFDDWLPHYTHPDMSNLMRIMLSVDPLLPNSVLDVKDLGVWSLNPLVIDYLKSNPILHLTPYDSAINIGLYKKRQLVDTDKLLMTTNAIVNCIEPLDEQYPYHLTISLVNRIDRLSRVALESLRLHGYFTVLYLVTLFPSIAQIGDEYYQLPNGQIVFLGDPATRPTCQFINGYRIATIRMPDGDIIQSHLLPCMRDGEFTPEQLSNTLNQLTGKDVSISINKDYHWRLVNNFVIQTHGN